MAACSRPPRPPGRAHACWRSPSCGASRPVKPWPARTLDAVSAADFAVFEEAQRTAGLPVTPTRAAAVTPAQHAAIPHLPADAPETLAAAGLDDFDKFVRDLLDAVYGPTDEADLKQPSAWLRAIVLTTRK